MQWQLQTMELKQKEIWFSQTKSTYFEKYGFLSWILAFFSLQVWETVACQVSLQNTCCRVFPFSLFTAQSISLSQPPMLLTNMHFLWTSFQTLKALFNTNNVLIHGLEIVSCFLSQSQAHNLGFYEQDYPFPFAFTTGPHQFALSSFLAFAITVRIF